MFTPQRKAPWTPLSSAPTRRTLNSSSEKGKTPWTPLSSAPTPPPTTSLAASETDGFDRGNSDDWRKFKEAGLLDESALEKKDHQALLNRISRLEKELFDYQYNMGLLLMEKKDLVCKTEELGQEVSEAEEILKRERAAHLIAVSEAQKREENLKKALNMERLSAVDLERALRDIHEEHTRTKATSETSVANLNARMEELQKLNLDVERRSCSVDARLAESDRKNSELDRKLQDLEVRENVLQTEQLLLAQDRESHELDFRKQKKDMLEWEKKLQEGEQRLCENRRILNEREEKLHETDISCKVKESNIEELQKKIDLANATLKKVEDDVKNQSAELDMKEKEAEAMRSKLEARQKQLQEEEERLDVREKVELEKLLDEHKVMLNTKMHEFESDMRQERTAFEDELKSRKESVDKKETEINHLEMKLGKRELALEKKSERVKDKESDFERKNEILKEQEKRLKAEDKRLEAEKKQVSIEKESLETLRKEIEMLRNDAKKQELHIEEEIKKLEDAEKERLEYLRLQSSLKQEINNVKRQSELIEKEASELKLEREKFEKDWEALDEKRIAVDKELKTLAEEKEKFEKLRSSEEERLRSERAENEERLLLESESIRLQKESFEAMMEHEKLMLAEEVEKKHAHMRHDFEQQKQDLYNDMNKRQEEWGKLVEEKERTLEEMRLREMRNVKNLKEDAERKMEEMEMERHHMEKEREKMELDKKQLEETGIEISKDIKALDNLSKKLKKHREQLVSEREHFGALVERIKSSKICGDSAQAFLHSDFQLPTMEGSSHFHRLSRDDDSDAKDERTLRDLDKAKSPLTGGVDRNPPQLGGQMSVLRKCASIIFNLSPEKGIQHTDNHVLEESPHSSTYMQANEHLREQTSAIDELAPAFAIVNDAINISQSDVREDVVDNSLTVDEIDVDSEIQGIKEPEKSDLRNIQRKRGRKRGSGVRRTHSVKAVVEDAKAFLRDSSVGTIEEHPDDSMGANVNKQEKNLLVDMTPATSARKRSRSQASKVTESEQDADQSEGHADSVTTGNRRKRRQTVAPALPTPGQRRYNLRRHAVATPSAETETGDEVTRKGTNQAVQNPNETPVESLDIAVESDRRLHVEQDSTTRSVEFSSDRCNNTTTNVAGDHVDDAKSVENNAVFVREVKTAEDTLLGEINGTSVNVEEDNRSMVKHQ
ncbi:hypothetical protein BVRB_6g141190 [Beta vulgaris subsp. vulgaris]|nr:hypothetical protein BVRB_6g141190 [Beta vulgaris subsp. vulgaris]